MLEGNFVGRRNTRKNDANRDDERSTTRGSESRLLTGCLKIVGETRSEGTLENGGGEDTSATANEKPRRPEGRKSNGAWARFFFIFFFLLYRQNISTQSRLSLSVSAHIAES